MTYRFYDHDIMNQISNGRTDLVIEFLKLPDWKSKLNQGDIKLIQWLVYYDDVTALRLVLDHGGDISTMNIHDELGNAAFFGHFKTCDFLIEQGADINYKIPDTNETPLHNALCKAGKPYFIYVIRLLLEQGADVNAATVPGKDTGGFMRDVRTCGETPLHRAAAFADEDIIQLLLDYGADKKARDANGDSPLTWASMHLRPGSVLEKLAFGEHHIGPNHVHKMKSDHGNGWGNGMDWNLMGDYISLNEKKK